MLSMLKLIVLAFVTGVSIGEGQQASGQMVFLPDVQDVTSVAWSPDGNYILSSGFDGTIRLWKSDTCHSGPFIYIDDPRVPEGEDRFRSVRRGVMSVAWSPDGKRFVAGLRDRTVRLYQLEWNHASLFQEVAIFTVEGQGGLRTVAYSADGRMVASAGHDGAVRLWEAENMGTMLQEFSGHDDVVEGVIFSPDARIVISAGHDRTIRKWDVTTGRLNSSFQAPGPVSALALSRDGQFVAGGITRSDGKHLAVLWRVDDWQEVQIIEITGRANSMSFSPDGKRLAVALWGGGGGIWSVETGKASFKLDQGIGIRGISYSPDGNFIAVGGETLFVINAGNGEIVREFGKCQLPSKR
jgi:WD40 repeat protein